MKLFLHRQRFRLDIQGHLISRAHGKRALLHEELCVHSDLRLDVCRDDEQEIWMFTQVGTVVSLYCVDGSTLKALPI